MKKIVSFKGFRPSIETDSETPEALASAATDQEWLNAHETRIKELEKKHASEVEAIAKQFPQRPQMTFTTCINCGRKYRTKPSKLTIKFCSMSCRTLYSRKEKQ